MHSPLEKLVHVPDPHRVQRTTRRYTAPIRCFVRLCLSQRPHLWVLLRELPLEIARAVAQGSGGELRHFRTHCYSSPRSCPFVLSLVDRVGLHLQASVILREPHQYVWARAVRDSRPKKALST